MGTSSVERPRGADAHGVLSESVDRSRRAALRRRAGLVAAPALDAPSRALRGRGHGGASYPRRASGHPLTQADGFAPGELRRLRALRTPWGIQRALDAMPYHLAGTAWSPRAVLREGTAHCLEGAVFAAAALRVLGHPPLLLDLEAVQDTDHVIALFRLRGERTLRAFSRPVNLARFDRLRPGWMVSDDDLWWIAERLVDVPHSRLLSPAMVRALARVDRRSMEAALAGYRAHARAVVTPRTPGSRRGRPGRLQRRG